MGEKAIEDCIAIVGMAGRFPMSPDLDTLWNHLVKGEECIRFFSPEEVNERNDLRFVGFDPTQSKEGHFVPAKPELEQKDLFDAGFFGYSPNEAMLVDPQQRIFLELAWQAFEHAGYDCSRYEGVTGVFAGQGVPTYMTFYLDPAGLLKPELLFTSMISNSSDFLSSRVAFKMGLNGPALGIQAACSTSLFALHYASQSLLNFEIDMAIAGAVDLQCTPTVGHVYTEGAPLTSDGHCNVFDANATGTIFGEGAGAVVLKRAEDAIADGDSIHGIIRGSGVSNDGAAKANFMAPGSAATEEAAATALGEADVPPESITYMEVAGSGNPMADPIEIGALQRSYADETDKTQFCRITSSKPNIGHTISASGMASLFKVLYAFREQTIPPHINVKQTNPHIDFKTGPFVLNQEATPWKPDGPRRAAINSFAIGGNGAHIILEEYVPPASPASHDPQLLVLSAKSRIALQESTTNLLEFLKKNENCNLRDLSWTLATGRMTMPWRRFIVASSVSEAISALSDNDLLETRTLAPTQDPTPKLSLPASRSKEDGETLGQAWLKGYRPKWKDWFGDPQPRRIPAPTYAFQRQRYWVQPYGPQNRAKEQLQAVATAKHPRPELPCEYIAPESDIEEKIASIWSDVFSIEKIGRHDNFLDLGGDSLMASRVFVRLKEEFDPNLPAELLLEAPTPAETALVIEKYLEDLVKLIEGLSEEEALAKLKSLEQD